MLELSGCSVYLKASSPEMSGHIKPGISTTFGHHLTKIPNHRWLEELDQRPWNRRLVPDQQMTQDRKKSCLLSSRRSCPLRARCWALFSFPGCTQWKRRRSYSSFSAKMVSHSELRWLWRWPQTQNQVYLHTFLLPRSLMKATTIYILIDVIRVGIAVEYAVWSFFFFFFFFLQCKTAHSCLLLVALK